MFTQDEAKILRYVFLTNEFIPTITVRLENEKGEGVDYIIDFSDIGELAGCERPMDINNYFDNLIRLGLLKKAPFGMSLVNKELYEPLKNHPYILSKKIVTDIYPEKKIKEEYIELTNYGKLFCQLCVVDYQNIVPSDT